MFGSTAGGAAGFCISHKLPRDTVAAGARTTLGIKAPHTGDAECPIMSSSPISFLLVLNVYVTK